MDTITRQDVDILIEALDAWERGDGGGRIIGSLMGAMIAKDMPPEAKAKLDAEMKAEDRKREDAAKLRKERAIVLKAKLLAIRDSRDADKVLDDAHSGK